MSRLIRFLLVFVSAGFLFNNIAHASVQNVTVGQAAIFSVVVQGTAPFSYQWYKNGNPISGATSASYSIAATALADAGTYDVLVANAYGSTTSDNAVLTVSSAAAAPSITTQPASSTVTAGQAVAFSVTATGTGPLSYQWYKNGALILGATSASYSIGATTSSDAGTYTVVISNTYGSTTSSNATLTVNAAAIAPSITTQPASLTVTAGQSAAFSFTAVGTGPLSYQWYKNGVPISGATSASYSISAATTSDAGTYAVVISSAYGSSTSSNAVLTVNVAAIAPSITTQPVSLTVTAGQSATFTVTAIGTGPLYYQWYQNGSQISGATSASYTISSATASNAGSYAVVITSAYGGTTSAIAVLTVNAAAIAPSITTQPASLTVTAGQSASFSFTAVGTGPLYYQWYKNGAPISGATSASYTISSTTTSSAGTYAVVISSSYGSTTSNNATLTVNAAAIAPSITAQPVSLTVTAGQSATFSVTAVGTGPLNYQWYKNGTSISGATSASYTISATTTSSAGSYAVVISSAYGSTTSGNAVLAVNAVAIAPSITTQPAALTVTAGQSATFSFTAVGTGPLYYQWYKNGTPISGATSASYSINATTSSDAGSYAVVISSAYGSTTSNNAALTVNAPVSLTELKPISFSAHGENLPSEGIAQLFDGQISTKWLDPSSTTWVQVVLAGPAILQAYSLTSANDVPARDPVSWTLSGSNDGVTWIVLDTRSGQSWSSRFLTRDFVLSSPSVAYSRYRFDFTSTPGNCTQLAELELSGTPSVPTTVQLIPAAYSARGDNGLTEGIAQLFDGLVSTKWLDFKSNTWVRVDLSAPAVLQSYTLTSANDNAWRDPIAWTLSGSNDGGATWTVIEKRSGQSWSSRFLARDFVLATPPPAYKQFRFDFKSTPGNFTQLAELALFGSY